jgi:2-polyprenyl-3-methyl-5-hydroxy-6-metoxy-1,4-benzoquinol methylase
MCGSRNFKLLGLRLNRSQGMNPRGVGGIAVSVKQCRDCDLIFSDPQPIPADISDHYGIPPEEYWSEVSDWSPDYFSDQIQTAQRLLDFKAGMTALDIGAGLGHAMRSLAEAGFDVRGIEPAKPFHHRAIQQIDPERLTLSTIEDADFPDESFDFITFGAVLEHLYSPGEALAKAMRWLKPGGIVQAEVPNANHLVAKLVDIYFRLHGTTYVTHLSPMHAPFHLHEFTLRSFRRYEVADHHFDVCTISHFPRALHPLLRWWMARTDTGMQLTVYLKRSPPSELRG